MVTVPPPARAKTLIAALCARPDVEAVTLFGSRARNQDDSSADQGSDYDVQVVAANPARLTERDWANAVMGEGTIVGWSVRDAMGGTVKVSVLLIDEEIDLVLVPGRRLRPARWALRLGLHRRSAWVRRQLTPLVLVIGRGYRVLKGGNRWEHFWFTLFRDVPVPGLSDTAVRNLGQQAQVDFVSIKRKLDRGELRAAQRWLHTGLAEINFELMHEWRRRRGEPSFHDGRRVESILPPAELELITVNARLDATEIAAAAERAARVAQQLVDTLVGSAKRPPTA